MFGQGSPFLSGRRLPPGKASHPLAGSPLGSAAIAVCFAVCALLSGAAAADDEPLDLEFWIAWGGGPPEPWTGEIRLEPAAPGRDCSGLLLSFEPVGLSPDEPGSMYLSEGALIVAPIAPRNYDAVRLKLRGSPTDVLSVSLASGAGAATRRQIRVPISEGISGDHTSTLDDRGNGLLIRRAPGDDLRVRLERESLVFAPGERLEFHADLHAVPVEPDASLEFTAQLRKARSETVVWEEVRDARADARGETPEVGPFSLSMPEGEGAYDLWVSASQRRLPTRFSPSRVIAQRMVQGVVVAPQSAPASSSAWETIAEWPIAAESSDSPPAASPSWLLRSLPKLTGWAWIPGTPAAAPRPLGNGSSRTAARADRQFVELQPGGWLAYALPVASPGMPHLLEVEYPDDAVQTLSVSVLEPDAAGVVSPVGMNHGLDVAEPLEPAAETPRYRCVFWPRTSRPLLLLTNRRADASAWLGRVRLSAGPLRLPAQDSIPDRSSRLLALYMDRPLLVENFGGLEAGDRGAARSLTDWETFLQSGGRLAEYARYAGYNGALVAVAHEGGTLYPSRWLQPTPKYDNGVFFGTAQDPLRKDVLELLYRIFDREGLRLVASIHFGTLLPELESLRRGGAAVGAEHLEVPGTPSAAGAADHPRDATGIDMVSAEGLAWRSTVGESRATGPFYNPLDPRVQRAMQRVVLEVAERYAAHASFAGVALHLGPETFAQLPDAEWACDAATLERFAREERLLSEGKGQVDTAQLIGYLRGGGRQRWLEWRASRLAEFYEGLGRDVRRAAPQSRLYLAGANMLDGFRGGFVPQLPERWDASDQLLRVGFRPERYPDTGDVVLLRPYPLAPLVSLEAQAASLYLRQDAVLDAKFAGQVRGEPAVSGTAEPRTWTGSLLFREPHAVALEAFQETSPFGADKTSGWLLAQLSPVGPRGRQPLVHAVAAQDSEVVFDGGWLVPLDARDAMATVGDAFRSLPAGRFLPVEPRSRPAGRQPVAVRRLVEGGRTHVYLANDSPWKLNVTLELETPPDCRCEIRGNRQVLPPVAFGKVSTWTVALEPFDLVAAAFSRPDVAVRDWRLAGDRDVLVALREDVDDLRRRANQLRKPPPLQVLANARFELPGATGSLPGWECSQEAGVRAESLPGQGRDGSHGLRLASPGPVGWIRSNTFASPKTGRLAVSLWLRVSDATRQPPLQLAIEGSWNGEPYYRPARVGGWDAADKLSPPPLNREWSPYLVRVDNLPASGLADLRVAIDLMGAGEVWVDDVEVYDLWFDKNERNELLKTVALANFYLGKGDAVECHGILGSYWPEFLRRHVAAETLGLPVEPQPLIEGREGGMAGPSESAAGDSAEASTSWLKRILPKSPRIPTWFR